MATNVYVLGQPLDRATSWANSFSNSEGELRALPDFNQITITPGTKMTPSLLYVSVHVSSGKPEKPRLLSASGKPEKQSPLGNRSEKLNLVCQHSQTSLPSGLNFRTLLLVWRNFSFIPTYLYLYLPIPTYINYTHPYTPIPAEIYTCISTESQRQCEL